MRSELPWKTTGPLDDGLPFNYGIIDRWGVVIGRFDDAETASMVAKNMSRMPYAWFTAP